jgi:hypothetical protein
MLHVARLIVLSTTLAAAAACATAGATSSLSNLPASGSAGSVGPSPEQPNAIATARADAPCNDCDAIPMPAEITHAVESRIADLKNRGGDCSRYGAVLESSYRGGQITIRPYMWRVGSHLASGEAKPNGAMTLAREIDSLNVGVRTVNDVLWTMEHEAAHIAFELASGNEASEEKANQTVRACRT